jgi:molybdopterin synthase catalytic subunit
MNPAGGVFTAEAGIHRKGEVSLAELIEGAKRSAGKELGALGCFIGVVRETSKGGERVERLHYEAAEEAEKQLLEIATRAERRPGIMHVGIHHVIDDLSPGEDAVYVVVGGRHREEVFAALPEIMERVKREALIWKKEVTEGGGRWV